MNAYVYVLFYPDFNAFKIGKAKDIASRIKTLIGSWGEPDYSESYAIKCRKERVYNAEKALHNMLSDHKKEMPSGDGRTEFFEKAVIAPALKCIEFLTLQGLVEGVKKGISEPKKKPAIAPFTEEHSDAFCKVIECDSPAHPIFQMMLKEKLTGDDCKQIMASIRAQQKALKLDDLLPLRWAARYIPKGNDMGNVANLAELWGLQPTGTKSNGKRLLSIQQKAHTRSIIELPIEGKAKREQEVLALLDDGQTLQAIAAKLGCSLSTVKRLKRGSKPAKEAAQRYYASPETVVDMVERLLGAIRDKQVIRIDEGPHSGCYAIVSSSPRTMKYLFDKRFFKQSGEGFSMAQLFSSFTEHKDNKQSALITINFNRVWADDEFSACFQRLENTFKKLEGLK
jgi:hypothetical protein